MNDEPKKTSMYEVIADKLEEMILNDEMSTDDRLPSEAALATSFGVSRPVIREALMLLNARGLISQKNGDGTYVSQPSSEDFTKMIRRMVSLANTNVTSLFEVRISLEVLSAQLAAFRATSEDVGRLTAINGEMQRLADNSASFAAKDVEFHNEIAKIAGNDILYVFLSSLNAQISEMIEHNLHLRGATDDAVKYHGKIIEAIRSNSPEKAADVMRSHVLMFMRNAESHRRKV